MGAQEGEGGPARAPMGGGFGEALSARRSADSPRTGLEERSWVRRTSPVLLRTLCGGVLPHPLPSLSESTATLALPPHRLGWAQAQSGRV